MEVIAAGIFRRPQPIALRTTVQLSAAWGRCDARPRQPAALVTRVAIRAPALTPTRAVRWASGGSVSGGSGSSSLAKGFSRHADSIMQRESAPSAQKHKVDVLAQEPSILLPGTFVTPQWSTVLANPRGLLWPLFRVRLSDFLSRLQFRLSSYSGTPLFSTPRWRAGSRRDIAQAGRDLHARMHGAVAAGDLAAIKSVCMPQLARTLSAAVAARPRGQRVEWEVLGYGTGGSGRGGTRLLDHKIAVLPLGPSPTDPRVVQRQAVVAVRSRQRLARYDAATGRPIPGSERVRELDEYLVLHRYVLRDDDGGDGRGLGGSGGKSKKKTPFKETPWKVFGTLSPTTADSWREAMALQETIMKQEAERKLAAPR